MGNNVKIARELVRLANSLVDENPDDAGQPSGSPDGNSNFMNACRNAMRKFVADVEKLGWIFAYTSSDIYDYDEDKNREGSGYNYWSYGIDVMFWNPKTEEGMSDSEREEFLESEKKRIEGIMDGKKYRIMGNENIEVSGVYSYFADNGDPGDERITIAIDRRKSFDEFDSLWHDFLCSKEETDRY